MEGYVSESGPAAGAPADVARDASAVAESSFDRRRVAEFLFEGRTRGLCLVATDALMLILGVGAAGAQDEGFYLGGSLGQSRFKEWCDTGGSAITA